MNESTFTRNVNRCLPKQIYVWKVSDRFTAGIPDSWYSGRNDLWVEWKFAKTMPKSVLPKLSALQKKWLNNRYSQGRNVAVIVGSPAGSLVFTNGEWNNKKNSDCLLNKHELVEWLVQQIEGMSGCQK